MHQQGESFEEKDKIHSIWPQKKSGYFERTLTLWPWNWTFK